MKIALQHLSAESTCETCGWNYESGGRIWFDDALVFEHVPTGGCTSGSGVEKLHQKALELLGHEIIEVEDYPEEGGAS